MPHTTDARARGTERAHATDNRAIDRWQLVDLLGEGRWTSVYRARPVNSPESLPSDYTVKLLKPEFESDTVARSLMHREAEVGRAVSNSNLVSILSAHVENPPYYVVTPFLEGATLASLLLRKRPLCLPQILWIARQIVAALQALHVKRWLHGDVKPTNVFVSPLGHVTLIDLGFARQFESLGRPSNELVGTMNYAAPELFVAGQGRDGQSDVYSVGIILFEMLARRLPFVHEDACDLALAHLREQAPDPRTFSPTLPRGIAGLVKRMLAKEPLRRPRASEAHEALTDFEIETFSDWEEEEAAIGSSEPAAVMPDSRCGS